MLRKLDNYVIEKLQLVYNDLWDNYGLTKGMLKAAPIFTIACSFIIFEKITPEITPLLLSLGLLFGTALNDRDNQIRNRLKILNDKATDFTHNSLFLGLRAVFFPAVIIIYSPSSNFLAILSAFLFMLENYINCLYVKERNPPENFNYASNPV